MVRFSSFATGHWTYGSPKLERYDGVPSIEIMGSPAPGQSTGTAMAAMEELARKLPAGFGYEWTGLSYEEKKSGSETGLLYGGSLIVVFLCLAALYESWSIPAAVLLVVPLGVMGAVLATWLRGLDNDVYFQVGLLTTIGLSAKNAILIVEFAKANFEAGMKPGGRGGDRGARASAADPDDLDGVHPRRVAAGAVHRRRLGGQNAIGTGVIGGMATRHGAGDLLGAGVLRRRAAPVPGQAHARCGA